MRTQRDLRREGFHFIPENGGLDEFAPEPGRAASPVTPRGGTFDVVPAGRPTESQRSDGHRASDPLPPRFPPRPPASVRWRRRAQLLKADVDALRVTYGGLAVRRARVRVQVAARTSTQWLAAHAAVLPTLDRTGAIVGTAVGIAVVAGGGLLLVSRPGDSGPMRPVSAASPETVAPAPAVVVAGEAAPPSAPIVDDTPPPSPPEVDPAPVDVARTAEPRDRPAPAETDTRRTEVAVARAETAVEAPPADSLARLVPSGATGAAALVPTETGSASPMLESAPTVPTTGPVARTLPAPDPVAAQRAAVGEVLAMYRRSYNALDASSVATIWQGVDLAALRRAFSSLRRQHVTFRYCDVTMNTPDQAHATCDGTLSHVPKLGDEIPHTRLVSWSIELRRVADRWVIVGLTAR